MTQSINDSIQYVFTIAKGFAREYYNKQLQPAHILRALLHPEAGLCTFLEALDLDISYLVEWAEVRMDEYPKCHILPDTIEESDSIYNILDEATHIKIKFGFADITAFALFAAICKPGVAFSADQLKSFPLREHDLMFDLPANPEDKQDKSPNYTSAILQKYCTDKTALAFKDKLDPVVGREMELRQIIEILGRRTKPNVIIAGEAGVGKSTLINGLALAIAQSDVPVFLQKAILYELNLSTLCAGATYKGEVEDRMQKIIAELSSQEKTILFIDEIHTLTNSKGSLAGTSDLLKPILSRGEITVIGATTPDEYRKLIEPERAFNRRFELLQLNEPDLQTAERMLELHLPLYEQHHQVAVEKDVIPECIRLAKRYIKDKKLPDAAFDLLDRTMASIRTSAETMQQEVQRLQKKSVEIKEAEELSEQEKQRQLVWLNRSISNSFKPLHSSSSKELEVDENSPTQYLISALEQTFTNLNRQAVEKKNTLCLQDLAATISIKTGIPIGDIQAKEKEKLLNMHRRLKQRIIGQDHALKAVSEAILENRSGLNKPGQPIGSFFLLGPTGTGKTELAKSIAAFLFNDEKAMIRFDMSEFKEEHSAALLYGAPPGYVGYEEGGLLVNKIRQQPYSVVLFDEIEKAHQSVFDVFLQIMDEGHIHDKQGKEGDFSNALILFTSNINSDFIAQSFEQNKIPAHSDLLEKMRPYFRPEFLGRITEIVPFGPVTEDMAKHIFDLQLQSLVQALSKQNIQLVIGADARLQLVNAGFSSTYGARQIASVIRHQIRRPVSRMIVSGLLHKDSMICIDLNDNNQLSLEVLPATAGHPEKNSA
ncbi:ATP-dependent Clp protease ATP-binding subunit [Danxiaibacter flavus]|uniref:ATP-dependent Clp protease ATP-binding subunit n=1 Tax=Danxiaibacter flavus TaxID=3049108 RepID=A0ABV3ZCQ3_9BACT|nr:ATP-dependent Clp protease ATP-binding subunit [Chitinophagaceae bacterium DXS]